MKLPELSLFMPAYNEADNLMTVIPSTLQFLSSIAGKYEFLIIYDQRSRDNSLGIIQELCSRHPQLRVVMQPESDPGYGRALALGWKESRYPVIFYTDADDQYDIADLEKMLPLLDKSDLVIGYRSHRKDPLLRLLVANLYNKLIQAWFKLEVGDVDCSFKLIKKQAVEKMTFICRTGALEIELLLKAREKGCRLVEIPVRHRKRRTGISSFETGEGRLFGLPRYNNVAAVFREMLLLRKIFPANH